MTARRLSRDLAELSDAYGEAARSLQDAVERVIDPVCRLEADGLTVTVGDDLYEVAWLTWPSDAPGVHCDPDGAVTLLRNGVALVDVRPAYCGTEDLLVQMPDSDFVEDFDVRLATDADRVEFAGRALEVITELGDRMRLLLGGRTEDMRRAAQALDGLVEERQP